MGLESRDYYRDGSYTKSLAGWGLEPLTPVVKYLIVTNVIVFLLQIFITRSVPLEDPADLDDETVGQQAEAAKARTPDPKGQKDEGNEGAREKQKEAARKARREMERLMNQFPSARVSVVQVWLELDPEKTFQQGQVWRLLTGAFCHAREMIWHILFNMLLLYWFGTRLETMYGSREFLLFYLVATVCSSLAYIGLARYTGSITPAIGASGAVMGGDDTLHHLLPPRDLPDLLGRPGAAVGAPEPVCALRRPPGPAGPGRRPA